MRKRSKWLQTMALSMAAALTVTGLPVTAYGAQTAPMADQEELSAEKDLNKDGYTLKWEEEFEGDSLNLDDWNVEEHPAGWVNKELQEYPKQEQQLKDNISLKDGILTIKPVKTKNDEGSAETTESANLLKNTDFSSGDDGFSNWTETIANWGGADGTAKATRTLQNGSIVYDITNPGTEEWNVQLKQQGVSLKSGGIYKLSFDAETTAARSLKSGFMSTTYSWYGGGTFELEPGKVNNVSFEFTMPTTDDASDFYISLGQMYDDNTKKAIDTPAAKVTISNIKLESKAAYAGYSFTSGRISTENKHNFTYGLFEARAKVPSGAGYLPAFWLMAANESADNEYGTWPTCGEIDMMEVLGDDTNVLHGTIHYGNPHEQRQGTFTNTVSGNSFSDEFHIFQCEWEPGKITWYVDGKEYYSTSNWFSASDDGKTLTYPAPFDHDMYVILNLAVGGEWVGYPDAAAMEDMDNQNFQIDYVKVYQKDSYDENVTQPEVQADEDGFRQAVSGNYILNGDFSVAEKLEKIEGEKVTDDEQSWIFMTANDGVGSATISGNEILIKTENEGTVDYSVQLVQAGLPLVNGKKYQISFDACASEARQMQYAIQNTTSWKAYAGPEIIDLTTEYQTYTTTFNMNRASDKSARLDFNMGNFGSTADIRIKNVVFTCLGDAEAEEVDTTKYPRFNGNHVYNGGFEEGEARLGSWDVKKDSASEVYVTNDNVKGVRVRELTIKASDAVSKENPIVVSQDILLQANLKYNLKLDAKADNKEVQISFGDVKENVKLGKEMATIAKELTCKNDSNKTFAITITEPGEYVFDNVYLSTVDNGIVKNGAFTEYGSFWTPFVDSNAKAKTTFKNQAAQIDVEKIGSLDWHIQLNQDGVKLEKGKTYKLSFKAKASVNRKIKVTLQEYEGAWTDYSGALVADLTDEYKTFEKEFTMKSETDEKTRFNIAAGVIDGETVEGAHTIWVEDISLEEVKVEDNTTNNNNNQSNQNQSSQQNTQNDPSKSTSDGVVQKGESAVTSDAVVTATSAKEASFKAADTFNKTSYVIPDTAKIDNTDVKITTIEKNAFNGNNTLKSVTIGKNIKKVEKNAFKGCKKLKKIKIYAKSKKTIDKTAFKGCPNKKSTKVTIVAKNKSIFNKIVKQMKKAGLKKATYKFVKL